MIPPLVASFATNQIWFLFPLIIVVSLVYGATRHELMGPILHHAVRAAAWMLGFMGVVFLVLLFVSWGL